MRLIREGWAKEGSTRELPDEEAIIAYVLGRATRAQEASVQAAMASNRELRLSVLELMARNTGSTELEREEFERAVAPSLGKFPALIQSLSPAQAIVRTRESREKRRRSWAEWALGGWALAATASSIALLFAMQRSSDSRLVSPAAPPAATPPSIESSGQSPATRLNVVPVIRLTDVTRGSQTEIPRLVLDSSLESAQLRIESLPEFDEGSRVHVGVLGETGSPSLDTTLAVEDIWTHALVLARAEGLHPGRYILRIEGTSGSRPKAISYEFLLDAPTRK
jgi:hypothetical protein